MGETTGAGAGGLGSLGPALWLDGNYRALFEHFPDGIVILDPALGAGEWPIVDCNPAFVAMNGYKDRSELIGQDIRFVSLQTALDVSPDEYRLKYYSDLATNPHIRFIEKHVRRNKVIFWIDVSTCLVREGGREWVLGVDRDITREHEYLEDLRKDVGRTFHTVTATLLEVELASETVIGSLGDRIYPPGELPAADEVWESLVGPRNQLVLAIGRLVETIDPEGKVGAELTTTRARLQQIAQGLDGLELSMDSELRIPVVQDYAREVSTVVGRLVAKQDADRLLRDRERETLDKAQILDRMSCQLLLQQSADRVLDGDELLGAVRERVLRSIRPLIEPETFELWNVVREVMRELSSFAHRKHLEIRTHDASGAKKVRGVKQDVKQIIYNLLHNAIKYSYSRPRTAGWIDISAQIINGQRLRIEIVDYGVPIPLDELQTGAAYWLGFRGRLSGESGRSGTGIGLYEARVLARENEGGVWLTSHPALKTARPGDLTTPHRVTAYFELPIRNE